jgi:N-acetylglucosaminyldiphosphoundecaprenol N-acetyl-beta-D-mannosaminyltransferase
MNSPAGLFISGIRIDPVSYTDLLNIIKNGISSGSQVRISYLNAAGFNLLYRKQVPGYSQDNFDIIHADGIGVYLAIRFILGAGVLKERFTGSDFYPLLYNESIKNRYSIFFFGHDDETLSLIHTNLPHLKIAGIQNGYGYNDETVVEKINNSGADILVIGLGFPVQEKWVIANSEKLKCRIILCTGEGIRVFAGTKKRGPEFIQYLGLEWLVRFLSNPVKFFSRYIIGIPLFLYRIIVIKIRNLA